METLCRGQEQATDLQDASFEDKNEAGFSRENYFILPFERRKNLRALGTIDFGKWKMKMLAEMKGEMRRDLVEDIREHPDRWPYRSGFRDSLEKDPADPGQWPMKEMPIEVIDERAHVNCLEGEYVYQATLAVSRHPLSKMPEIETLIAGGMRQPIIAALADLKRRGSVTLKLPEVAFSTLRHRVDSHEMRTLVDRYQKELQYVDDETQMLIKWLKGDTISIAPFETADYRLTGDISLVLRVLSSAFVDVVEPQSAYEIIVVGRADSRPLGSREYVGSAAITLPAGERRPFQSGSIRTATLQGNQELSVARGHSAAEELDSQLRSKAKVTLFYGGDGVVPGVATDDGRRLEVTMRRKKAD